MDKNTISKLNSLHLLTSYRKSTFFGKLVYTNLVGNNILISKHELMPENTLKLIDELILSNDKDNIIIAEEIINKHNHIVNFLSYE